MHQVAVAHDGGHGARATDIQALQGDRVVHVEAASAIDVIETHSQVALILEQSIGGRKQQATGNREPANACIAERESSAAVRGLIETRSRQLAENADFRRKQTVQRRSFGQAIRASC